MRELQVGDNRRQFSPPQPARRAAAYLALSLGLLLGLACPCGAQDGSAAERLVLEKARSLEASGHMDLAAQTWQQVLLSDPNNTEALAGLARVAKQSGNEAQAKMFLDRLRQINPNDPNIARAEGTVSNTTRDAQLSQASKLAQAGQPDAALRIYRQIFGAKPPDGDWAVAYYDTEASTPSGRADAIAGLRDLARRNPSDSRYAITLARVLTYSQPTRAEGERILRQYPDDAEAQKNMRQALLWDSQNPNAAAAIREYLKQHHDADLAQRLEQTEEKQAHQPVGLARTPEERAAFAALQGNRADDAQARFLALLEKDPSNSHAQAGMGFLRMQQGNFGGAISYLEQAQQNGMKDPSVERGLATSRFWFTVQEGTAALNEGRSGDAIAKYRAALTMRPRSPEALGGLSGALMKEGDFAEAGAAYSEAIKADPNSAVAWRGLFMAQQQGGSTDAALATARHLPAAVRTTLARDPDYLRALASTYTAAGDDRSAQAVLAQALDLPFPNNGQGLKTSTRLQYAALLALGKRYEQAVGLYKDTIRDDPSNVGAWQGLVNTLHQQGQDAEAVAAVEQMPPATYDDALRDVGFLSTLASIYQSQDQLEVAESFLERAARTQSSHGQEPPAPLQLQLAAIELQRGNADQAYARYRHVLSAHPDGTEGWKGLLAAMHQTGHDQEALAQIRLIPAAAQTALARDVQYQQTLAAIYAATGNSQAALAELELIQGHYAAQGAAPPADVEIQASWLLYNTQQDRQLYSALMRLGGRKDLDDPQRRQIQIIWASWSARRAGQAADAGDTRRSLEILNAAAVAFPGNPDVSKSLAGGYLKAGQPKVAVEIYQTLDLSGAKSADYQAAVGAALAAKDLKQAEIWLRQGLEQYPSDSQMLASAARFESARGDNHRAAAYWRASIAAMPRVSPANELAHDLSIPEPGQRAASPQRTARDLASLLNPDLDEQRQATQVALPGDGHEYAYGDPSGNLSGAEAPYTPDPYAGSAPVVLAPPPQAQSDLQPSSVREQQAPQEGARGRSGGAQDSLSSLSRPRRKKAANQAQGLPDYSRAASPAVSEEQPTAPVERLGDYRPQSSLAGSGPAEPELSTTGPVVAGLTPSDLATAAPAPGLEPVRDYDAAAAPGSGGVEDNTASPLPVVEAQTQSYEAAIPPSAPQRRRITFAPQREQDQMETAADPSRSVESAPGPSAATDLSSAANSAPIENVSSTDDMPLAQTLPPLTGKAIGNASGNGEANPNTSGAYPSVHNLANSSDRLSDAAGALAAAGRPVESYHPVQYSDAAKLPTPQAPPVEFTQSAPPDQAAPYQSGPAQSSSAQPGASDDELEQRNLPPLRGPYAHVLAQPRATDPREEARKQLAMIEGGYSPWMGGSGIVSHRSGTPGYDSLTAFEAPFEASSILGSGGSGVRMTVVSRTSFLDSGVADGTSTNVLGSLPLTSSTLPPQQNASGVGGELQLATSSFSGSVGYTPYGFLISNIIGRATWHPGTGPVTLSFTRDAVKDTQLSYSGLRDPGSSGPTFNGNIWGGVISNAGAIQFGRGSEVSGYYFGGGGQTLDGYHVQSNIRVDGSAGAYWRVLVVPEMGSLTLGTNFFGMHYEHNVRYFTYGQGGYFSPSAYFLASVPFSWTGHYGPNFHYSLNGSIGGQAFQEDSSFFFPLDIALQADFNNQSYPAKSNVGGNYDFHGQGAYRIADHWYVGAFVSANNSRDYTSTTAGFYVRYLLRPQYPNELGPTGMFPSEGLRPLMIP